MSLLLMLVGVVLLVACSNVASMLIARASARQQEFATRLALGAGRRDVFRELTVESVLLAALGGGIGLALALVAMRLVTTFASAVDGPFGTPERPQQPVD